MREYSISHWRPDEFCDSKFELLFQIFTKYLMNSTMEFLARPGRSVQEVYGQLNSMPGEMVDAILHQLESIAAGLQFQVSYSLHYTNVDKVMFLFTVLASRIVHIYADDAIVFKQ